MWNADGIKERWRNITAKLPAAPKNGSQEPSSPKSILRGRSSAVLCPECPTATSHTEPGTGLRPAGSKVRSCSSSSITCGREERTAGSAQGGEKSQEKGKGRKAKPGCRKADFLSCCFWTPVPLPCTRRTAPLQAGSPVPCRKAPPSQDKQSFPGFFYLFLRNNNPFQSLQQAGCLPERSLWEALLPALARGAWCQHGSAAIVGKPALVFVVC